MGKETTYGVWAVRSGASIFGHAEAWCKEDGKPLEFDTREAAEAYAREMNSKTTANVPVSYTHLDVYKRQCYGCRSCSFVHIERVRS